MDVRVYIVDEAALVVLRVSPDVSGLSEVVAARLAGYRVHASANGLYEFLAVRQ